ncbi:protein GVQW3-like [Ooceraea biroi]|uniref:protein GVQW3-like n=1 Tax=Ooceraea biroi TaxID=2015173 RepID=UPI000F078406|nr:protein GVQW3-like [Ooceraea biroi]
MSERNYEQRCAIKFCLKLGYNATKTLTKLQQAYSDAALSRAQVFKWFKAFSEGRESVEDESRSGRPSTSRNDENVKRIRDLVRSDRRLTVRLIADELNLNHTTVHEILINELEMRKICAKMVPKNLTPQQKENRKKCAAIFWSGLKMIQIFSKM